MGLDIFIATNNYKDVFTIDYFKNEKEFRLKMSLSRDFCNLMCRQRTAKGIPEFVQVAQLAQVDITSILDMENGSTNIDSVYQTITQLLERLSKIDNLEGKINHDGYDRTGIEYYFSDFNLDKGEGYTGNNFGQDLRNFKRFLEYAKSKGTTDVSFEYGS